MEKFACGETGGWRPAKVATASTVSIYLRERYEQSFGNDQAGCVRPPEIGVQGVHYFPQKLATTKFLPFSMNRRAGERIYLQWDVSDLARGEQNRRLTDCCQFSSVLHDETISEPS
jgi:hypothetical protein